MGRFLWLRVVMVVVAATFAWLLLLPLLEKRRFDESVFPTSAVLSFLRSSHGSVTEQTDLMRLLHSSISRPLFEGGLAVEVQGKTWTLWQEAACAHYKTRFGVGMPRVWLASFPCSGNTWMRYLLEAGTGVLTGSVFNDRGLKTKGFLGEGESIFSGRTLVQKTHGVIPILKVSDIHRRYQVIDPTIPTILLLRNPVKALVSYYKFYKSRQHTAQIPDKLFFSNDFHAFVNLSASSWEQLALDRLLWTKAPLHVMHYEHLLHDPLHELTRLLHFLGVPLNKGRMDCLAAHLDGSFKRLANKPLDPFTAQEKTLLRLGALRVNRTLQVLGYPPLPHYPEL